MLTNPAIGGIGGPVVVDDLADDEWKRRMERMERPNVPNEQNKMLTHSNSTYLKSYVISQDCHSCHCMSD